MKVLCIGRAHRFSPNSVERDAAILKAVAACLSAEGHKVNVVDEDKLTEDAVAEAEVLFSMAREAQTLRQLSAWTRGAKRVWNAPDALLQASRSALTELMYRLHIPQPAFERCAAECPSLPLPLWLKRGDASAQAAGDVCFVATEKELEDSLARFSQSGVRDLLAFAHEEGDLIKFYGVAETGFFRTYYPADGERFSKFGLERHNTKLAHYAFSEHQLKTSAEAIAAASGILIYGGDAIVRSDGSFAIIDFNDAPSFSPCRDDAARAIAALLTS